MCQAVPLPHHPDVIGKGSALCFTLWPHSSQLVLNAKSCRAKQASPLPEMSSYQKCHPKYLIHHKCGLKGLQRAAQWSTPGLWFLQLIREYLDAAKKVFALCSIRSMVLQKAFHSGLIFTPEVPPSPSLVPHRVIMD